MKWNCWSAGLLPEVFMIRAIGIGTLCVGLATLAACSGNNSMPGSGAGGNSASTGGASGSGAVSGKGGTTGMGGMPMSGGMTGAGGMAEMGGTTGSSGAVGSGGMVGAGGATSMGGMVGAGGAMSMGGMMGAGGVMRMGGMTETGGKMGAGGLMAVGGMMMGAGGKSGIGGMMMGMGGATVHADAGVACHAPGTFSVMNIGMTSYMIDMMSNPTLTLCRGSTYMFSVNATGHPFYIKTSATTGTTPAYDTGVTNNGADSGTITFVVPASAPSTLFYHCSLHSAMGGTIDIVN